MFMGARKNSEEPYQSISEQNATPGFVSKRYPWKECTNCKSNQLQVFESHCISK